MPYSRTSFMFGLVAAAAASASSAQMPSIAGLGGLGGIPNISGIGMGNAAGVLGYCAKNNLLGGGSANATSVLDGLMKKPGVAGSKGLAAGQAGTIVSGKSSFSLGSVSDPIKSQACSMVLKQAGKFL
jgi:hypothetical protein